MKKPHGFGASVAPRALILAVFGSAGCTSHQEFWVDNMAVHHGYTDEEIARVLGKDAADVPALLAAHGVRREASRGTRGAAIKVLPYPGGRHPRIGFLDGAIDPHRGTKVSIFTPWDPRSYVVVDLPEALWWNHHGRRELLCLAHTHIPTHWDKASVELDRIDWTRGADGVLEFHRRLPNGVEFGARVEPRADRVVMTLTMKNGSDRTITGLGTQVCVMLKGARGFNAQTNDNKVTVGTTVACRSDDGKRHVVTRWDDGAVWNNGRCPCMHSNPRFPDLAPGACAVVRGELYFYDGADLEGEVRRRRTSVSSGR